MMGVRIASLLTTMSSSRSAAVVPVSPSGITFRSALANLSKRADAESDSTESDSQTNSGSGAASRFLIKQDKAQASSDSSSQTTATLPPASVVVANGRTWHTTRTMTGVRIASASTKTPSSTPATASPVNSAKQTKPDNDTLSGARTPSDAGALTTVTTPPTDQSVSSVADRSSGQDKVTRASDGPSGTYEETSDVPSSTAALDLAQQLIPSHAVTDPADGNATAVKQLNAAPPSDVMVAEEGQGLAPATPSGAPQAGAGIAAQIAGESFMVSMGLPAAAAPTSHGDWSMPAGKATAKETNSTSGAKNPDLGSTTEPGKSKAGDAAGTGSDGWSHGTQNSSQSTQHSQADPSQGAAAPAKSIDSGASQLQAALMHGASQEVATSLRSGSGVENLPHQTLQRGDPAANESDTGDAVASSGINAAKLIQTMGQTEMSVGMRSSEFGNISIRTSVSQQQMLAQISLDHSDLSQALSSHISALQSKLQNESGLHTLIEVNHQGALSSGDSGNSAQREQQEFVRSARIVSAAVAAEPETGLGTAALISANDGSRLDIRA